MSAPPPRETAAADAPADGELDRVVFGALRLVVGCFAVLMAAFAPLDPLYVDRGHVAAVAGVAVLVTGLFAGTFAWLRFAPPPAKWANPIAFGVAAVGLCRVLSLLAANPEPFQVHNLSVLVVGAGCVLLSPRWFAGITAFVVAAWWATAFAVAEIPDEERAEWVQAGFVTAGMIAVSAVVLTTRGRAHLALAAAQRVEAGRRLEAQGRLRNSETLAAITARFQTATESQFDDAVNASLRELVLLLRTDHAYLTRLDGEPLRVTVTHESAARGRPLRMPHLQGRSLAELPFFRKRLSNGEPVYVPDIELLPPEAGVEKAELRKLGSRAYLAAPIRRGGSSWGYIGLVDDAGPRQWSPEDVHLLQVVGGVIVTTLERRAAAAELRASEAKFRALYESNIVGVMFAGLDGRITEANDELLRTIGYERRDLPLRWDRLTAPEFRAADVAAVARLRGTGSDPPWEKEFVRKDGRRASVLIGGSLLSESTGDCVSFAVDLTARKAAEQTIRRLRQDVERTARLGTMGEMAAGIAHEVRQPLGAIANYANGARRRLEQGRFDERDLIKLLGDIAGLCDRATAVVGRIREFVKDRKPVAGPVDLNAAVRECLQLAKFELHEAGVTVETALADTPPVLTDHVQLTQVLLNLILNAVQAMERNAGPRHLKVTTEARENVVLTTVADTGPGVPIELRDRLFDQFFTTKPDGLGMGLSIAKSLAESHGGSLTLADAGPQGATLLLRLPTAGPR